MIDTTLPPYMRFTPHVPAQSITVSEPPVCAACYKPVGDLGLVHLGDGQFQLRPYHFISFFAAPGAVLCLDCAKQEIPKEQHERLAFDVATARRQLKGEAQA